jgi:predicted O-methyltransferase YrrM
MNDKIWESYLSLTSHLSDHYAATKGQQRVMCEIVEKLKDNSVVLELGTAHGLTAGLFLLSGLKNKIEYHGIDNFSLEGSYDEVKTNLDKLNIPYQLHVSNTHDYPWDKPIDFLFIDAGHDEANVKVDIEKYIPFVKSGGFVVFHDYDGSKDPSVTPHWAITHYGDIATGTWKQVYYDELALMIRQKP